MFSELRIDETKGEGVLQSIKIRRGPIIFNDIDILYPGKTH